jgi:hypothetical protein
MLANDLTGQLARERVADLHRQAERQRLMGLARTQRRGATAAGGVGGIWWRVREEPRCGRQGAPDRPINSWTIAVSGTVTPAAEDSQIRFLGSKVDAGHLHLTMGSEALIDRSTPPGT